MKKYIHLFFLLICTLFVSCEDEDKSMDITVMPPATTHGADTFGCLLDGWLYVGGRYWANWWIFLPENPPVSFVYDPEKKVMAGDVVIDEERNRVTFHISSPQKGKECPLVDLDFAGESLKDGTVHVTLFDTKRKIISGTFTNKDRLTNGRFDSHFRLLSEK